MAAAVADTDLEVRLQRRAQGVGTGPLAADWIRLLQPPAPTLGARYAAPAGTPALGYAGSLQMCVIFRHLALAA